MTYKTQFMSSIETLRSRIITKEMRELRKSSLKH
jgi:hypothetical protein